MDSENLQAQIDQLNNKMDRILDVVLQQQLKTESVEDLLNDLQIVGKDLYDTAVVELEDQKVEIDVDHVKQMGIRLLHNIGNIGEVLSLFESTVDLIKDVGPIVTESIIDLSKKLHEFEEKGYFEFIAETGKIIDNVITNFSKDDVALLAENIVGILNTVKNLTQPEIMKSMNNAIKVYGSLETEKIPEYSLFKMMREMNKPEMKRALGFMVTFMKNLSAA